MYFILVIYWILRKLIISLWNYSGYVEQSPFLFFFDDFNIFFKQPMINISPRKDQYFHDFSRQTWAQVVWNSCFFFFPLQSFPPYLIAKSVIVPPSKWTRKGKKRDINRSSNRLTAGFWLDKRVHHGGMRCLFCGGHNGCCRLAIGFSLESIFHRHANPPMSLIRLIFFPPTILYRPRWLRYIDSADTEPARQLARDFLKAIFGSNIPYLLSLLRGYPNIEKDSGVKES